MILLTAKGEESDRVIGLRLGADDYVVKPFSPAELVARVDAVLRRDRHRARRRGGRSSFGDLRDRPGRRGASTSAAAEVALTQREFDLLLFLARHPGQVFSRNQLMDAVWQYSFYTDTSTVTVHIRRLRAKIEPDPAEPALHPDGVGRRLPVRAMSARRRLLAAAAGAGLPRRRLLRRCAAALDVCAPGAPSALRRRRARRAPRAPRRACAASSVAVARRDRACCSRRSRGALMFVSRHDAAFHRGRRVYAGAARRSARPAARGGVCADVDAVRAGLAAVGDGVRDVDRRRRRRRAGRASPPRSTRWSTGSPPRSAPATQSRRPVAT